MREFLAMGGYAAYVWAAFGFAALVLVGLLLQSWQAARRRQAELEQLRRVARPRGMPEPQALRPTRQVAGLSAGPRPDARSAE